MATSNGIISRNDRLGPISWILCVQFLLAEHLVSLTTTFPYSRFDNYISDLGAVHCATLTSGFTTASHRVCSPFHDLLNASFVVEGILVAAGALLIRRRLPTSRSIAFAILLMVVAGIGFVLAGLAPNDVNLPIHYTGAVFALLGGGVGMTLIGATILARRSAAAGIGCYSLASGIVSLAGTVLLSSGVTLGIGVGGMERVAAYPYLIWLTLTGLYYVLRFDRRAVATSRMAKQI